MNKKHGGREGSSMEGAKDELAPIRQSEREREGPAVQAS